KPLLDRHVIKADGDFLGATAGGQISGGERGPVDSSCSKNGNAYFKISDPLKGTATWIAVHDATVANGTLHEIPGSFREEYEHSRDPFSDHHIRCFPPEERGVPVELPAGGVVFFCYGTAHCTRENRSDKERAGVAYHFLRADYAQEGLVAPDR